MQTSGAAVSRLTRDPRDVRTIVARSFIIIVTPSGLMGSRFVCYIHTCSISFRARVTCAQNVYNAPLQAQPYVCAHVLMRTCTGLLMSMPRDASDFLRYEIHIRYAREPFPFLSRSQVHRSFILPFWYSTLRKYTNPLQIV